MQVGGHDSFWTDWSNVEWVIAGVVATVVPIAGFVWRLSIKMALLEYRISENDKDEDRRHEENVHLQRGLQQRMDSISYRIDRVLGRPPADDRGMHG